MRPQNQPDNTIKTDGVYSRHSLTTATTTTTTTAMSTTSTKPPSINNNNNNSSSSSHHCYLPAEIQMIILEKADWKLHPTLTQVCRLWRHFIQTSARVKLNRYFPVEATTHGFDNSPGEAEFPRPRPWLHRSLAYLKQFIIEKNSKNVQFRACKIEVIGQRQQEPLPVESSNFSRPRSTLSRPVCRLWPDMKWGLFKDDPITIYPGIDNNNPKTTTLRIAPREIVVSFHCCDFCESISDKGNQIIGLGAVAKVSGYLNFVTEEVNDEMESCLKRRGVKPSSSSSSRAGERLRDWDDGTVVEFWMGRDPLLVFSPSRYDTDTLRLWFDARVRRCEIDYNHNYQERGSLEI
ncbi:hypothetical protein TWF730_006198 [Orbilia blumenaviensis]|uniref:F-box domain-containing protein n=1 Tax=Orbilia blumenaviensis TaxID=1796055 RepID=A0AAV9TWH1_9PEZI